jgi:hypothetical protein
MSPTYLYKKRSELNLFVSVVPAITFIQIADHLHPQKQRNYPRTAA